MKLAWNAIVKNEAAIIERCIKSLLPHVDCAIVVDTGSTDGTPDKIQQLFDAAGKPVEIRPAPFKNFEQARNEALRCARLSRLEWDYLLLADADKSLDLWATTIADLSADMLRAGILASLTNILMCQRLALSMAQSSSTMLTALTGQRNSAVILPFWSKPSRLKLVPD